MKYCYEEGQKRTGHVFMGEEITRSARIETLRDTLLEAVPQISADRAMIVTEAYQRYNSETIYIKRAKTLAELLEKLPITILDGELIVGSVSDKLRCAHIFPEFGLDWLIEELDGNPVRPEKRRVIVMRLRKRMRINFARSRTIGVIIIMSIDVRQCCRKRHI